MQFGFYIPVPDRAATRVVTSLLLDVRCALARRHRRHDLGLIFTPANRANIEGGPDDVRCLAHADWPEWSAHRSKWVHSAYSMTWRLANGQWADQVE